MILGYAIMKNLLKPHIFSFSSAEMGLTLDEVYFRGGFIIL